MGAHPRVVHVVLSLNPGGTERLVIELVKRLSPDLPMAICCLDEKGGWAPELEARGIPVAALGRRAGFTPSLGRAVARVASAHRADIIHCHHYSPFVYGALARFWRPRARIVFTEHGRLSDAPPSRRRRLANVVFSRVPSAVFAVSRELGDHLVAEGFPAGRVGVIYNGIDPGPVPDDQRRVAIRRTLCARDDTLVIGTIARLDPVKDLGTLIRAVAQVAARRPTLLVIVGDGPERPGLEAAAAAAGVAGITRWLGAREDARAWLAGFDVYVNSSISEGVSLTILEAMAAARAVVATRVGGTPEVLDDTCGRLVAPRSPEALQAALTELDANPSLRRSLGAAARRRVEEQFALDRMVHAYRDVYQAIAAGQTGDGVR